MFNVLIFDDQLFHNYLKNIPLLNFFNNPLIVFQQLVSIILE